MSNYMMYLLFVNPEMLLPGTRRNLFTTAYDELKDIIDKPSRFATAYKELKDILKDNKPDLFRGIAIATAVKELRDILKDNMRNLLRWTQRKPAPVKEEGLMGRMISAMLDRSKKVSEEESMEVPKEESKGGSKEKFMDDAWVLAQGLLALGDEKMWDVIQGVWVEMLCFSASRCRGYLHAKALGSGGEFLSYVWLLMSYMGMETLTERLQREELPKPHDFIHSGDPHRRRSINFRGQLRRASSTSTLEIRIDKV
ncbi:unnamed protein product [Urochloa humidicola]